MFPTKETIEMLRTEYPDGTRVRLVKMDDVQAPPIGTEGTVVGVDGIGSLIMHWDNGSSLHVLSVPRERFLDIASKLDSLAFDDDPYEYHDNEGVESISDIADNLLNPTYRKAIIKALQDKQEYYAEDEFDDANIAERAKDILDNLAEIFGSDEQED